MAGRGFVVTMVTVVVLGVAAASASAATFTVNTTADDMSTGTGGCTTGGTCTLREALNAASSGDTVVVPAGTYDIKPAAGFGALMLIRSVTIQGAGAGSTILDGGGSGGTQIFDVVAPQPVTISGVTLQHGSSARGGAVGVEDGASLTLSSVSVTDSTGQFGGGGIADQGTLVVENSSISGNSTTGGNQGGGIQVTTFASSGAISATIRNSTITGNTASGGGGGIEEENQTGGAATVAVTIDHSTIAGNVASTGPGGGIKDSGSASTQTLSVSDSTIAGNSAAQDGGGMRVGDNTSAQTFVNDTVVDNAVGPAQFGGDISVGSETPPTLTNTIVAQGSASTGPDCHGAVTSNGHNLEDQNGCGFTATGDLINTNPKLGPLADNGGPTQTMALQAGSPAINAGPNSGCPATDERGVTRPQGAACDIGAYEVAPPSATTGDAGGLSPTGATISASVANPDAVGATVMFKYGTTTAYGSTTAVQSAAALSGATTYTAALLSLKPNTTYHYTVVVTNPDGTSTGVDQTFTTSLAPNNFSIVGHKVSKSGNLTIKLSAPDAGTFNGKATFKVKVGKHHKTFTYGSGHTSAGGAGTVTMTIKLTKRAKTELLALGHATVSVPILFTPTGGNPAHKTTTLKIKVNHKHHFS